MKVYISLPMHGHTEEDVKKRADRAREYVERIVLNPAFRKDLKKNFHTEVGAIEVTTPLKVAAKINIEEASHYGRYPEDVEYMLADLREISASALVVALDGWQDSRGCLTEISFALMRGIAVVHLSEQAMTCTDVSLKDAISRMRATGFSTKIWFAFRQQFYDMVIEQQEKNPAMMRLGQLPGDMPY